MIPRTYQPNMTENGILVQQVLDILNEFPFAKSSSSARLSQPRCAKDKLNGYRLEVDRLYPSADEPDVDTALGLYVRTQHLEDVFFLDDEGHRCVYGRSSASSPQNHVEFF